MDESLRPAMVRDAGAPYGALDPEWALAAEETMGIARSAIWRHLGMYHETFNRATADRKWLRIYDQLTVILDKLDLTTGTKQRDAERNEFAMRMISELKREQG